LAQHYHTCAQEEEQASKSSLGVERFVICNSALYRYFVIRQYTAHAVTSPLYILGNLILGFKHRLGLINQHLLILINS
jgi:hypothetical protein